MRDAAATFRAIPRRRAGTGAVKDFESGDEDARPVIVEADEIDHGGWAVSNVAVVAEEAEGKRDSDAK